MNNKNLSAKVGRGSSTAMRSADSQAGPCESASNLAAMPRGGASLFGNHQPGSGVVWRDEFTRVLIRLCTAIAARRARGMTLRQAIKQPVWYWNNKPRFFRCDKSRRVRLSPSSIVRWYYVWKHSGPDALRLKYRCGADRIGAGKLERFLETAVSSGAASYAETYQALGDAGATLVTYHDALSPRTRGLLSALFAHRRKAAYITRVIRRALESGKK